jgi:hypothetical protein
MTLRGHTRRQGMEGFPGFKKNLNFKNPNNEIRNKGKNFNDLNSKPVDLS